MGDIIDNIKAASNGTPYSGYRNICNSCINVGCKFQSGIVRKECASYIPPHIEPDNCRNYVVQDSTTKNDLVVNKIRTEIEKHCRLAKENHCKYCSYCNSVMGVREILEIIDKYTESEEV